MHGSMPGSTRHARPTRGADPGRLDQPVRRRQRSRTIRCPTEHDVRDLRCREAVRLPGHLGRRHRRHAVGVRVRAHRDRDALIRRQTGTGDLDRLVGADVLVGRRSRGAPGVPRHGCELVRLGRAPVPAAPAGPAARATIAAAARATMTTRDKPRRRVRSCFTLLPFVVCYWTVRWREEAGRPARAHSRPHVSACPGDVDRS